MVFKKLCSIILCIVSFSPFIAKADIKSVCLNDFHSPCCQAWQDRFNAVDDQWKDFWQQVVEAPADSSTNVTEAVAAMRSYNCQLREVCENVDYSLRTTPKQREEERFIQTIGCYRPEDKKAFEFIEECNLQLEIQPATDLPNSCFTRAEQKVEEKMVLTKILLRKDAAHKKTGFLVTRLRDLLVRIRDDLYVNVETMVQRFDEMSRKIACTIEQCD